MTPGSSRQQAASPSCSNASPRSWRSTPPRPAMNESEARSVLNRELAEFAARTYAELFSLIGKAQTKGITGSTQTLYQLEFNIFLDSEISKNLRIVGSIDDGVWRS